MTTPLQNAVNRLHTSLSGVAGVTVIYTQNGQTPFEIEAIPGRTTVEAEFADGAVHTDRTLDFVVKIEDFYLTPAKGDVIDWDERKFEVMHPAGGKVFEEVGPYKQLYRIHTKEVYAG